MIIKVCGMRDAKNIQEVAELGIDLMGFIFYPKSPRYVQMISSQAGIIPDYSEERFRSVAYGERPSAVGVKRVGVFVDEMPQTIITRVYNYKLDYVQLHGQERPVMIENLRRTLVPDLTPHFKIIKVISVAGAEDVKRCNDYEGLVDLFLFVLALLALLPHEEGDGKRQAQRGDHEAGEFPRITHVMLLQALHACDAPASPSRM